MLLRKKVGYQYYQEESLLDKNSMFSIFFLKERTTQKSSVDTHRKSLISLKVGLFRKGKSITWIVFVRKSKGFFTMKTRKLIHVGKPLFWKSRARFQTGLQ